MSRRSTVKPGGGSTTWPGSASQLASGAGTAVTVGSGLTLSGGTLAVPTIANTLNPWFASAEAAIVAKLGLTAGTYAVAADDHYSAAGVLGWTTLTMSAAGIGGQASVPTSPTAQATTGGNMSKASTSYGFGFRVQYNPGSSGNEGYFGVSNAALTEFVLAVFANASSVKSIKAYAKVSGSSDVTAASSAVPDANFHTVLVAFKYAAGGSTLSLSVDGEGWLDVATSKNPAGATGFLQLNAGSGLVDKSIFVATV